MAATRLLWTNKAELTWNLAQWRQRGLGGLLHTLTDNEGSPANVHLSRAQYLLPYMVILIIIRCSCIRDYVLSNNPTLI